MTELECLIFDFKWTDIEHQTCTLILFKQTLTLSFRTPNKLEHVQVLVIELEPPTFGLFKLTVKSLIVAAQAFTPYLKVHCKLKLMLQNHCLRSLREAFRIFSPCLWYWYYTLWFAIWNSNLPVDLCACRNSRLSLLEKTRLFSLMLVLSIKKLKMSGKCSFFEKKVLKR